MDNTKPSFTLENNNSQDMLPLLQQKKGGGFFSSTGFFPILNMLSKTKKTRKHDFHTLYTCEHHTYSFFAAQQPFFYYSIRNLVKSRPIFTCKLCLASSYRWSPSCINGLSLSRNILERTLRSSILLLTSYLAVGMPSHGDPTL